MIPAIIYIVREHRVKTIVSRILLSVCSIKKYQVCYLLSSSVREHRVKTIIATQTPASARKQKKRKHETKNKHVLVRKVGLHLYLTSEVSH